MITLLLATRNAHKAQEIRAILGDSFRCLTLDDFPNPPKVIEDAATFAGNATKKAVQLAKYFADAPITDFQPGRLSPACQDGAQITSSPLVLADDSGLEVDALHGAPGVHSARFAALGSGSPGNSSSAENNAKLLRLLQDVPIERRTARFRCVLALTPVLRRQPEGASPVCCADEAELQTELYEGVCEGRILFAPRGHGGFGYDPLFVPSGHEQTFAELGEVVKNRFSHRALALGKLRHRLQTWC